MFYCPDSPQSGWLMQGFCRHGLPNFIAALTLVFASIASAPAAAQSAAAYSASEVKAAFLYHFGSYVRWPPAVGVAQNADDPLTISVLGAADVVEQLERFLPGRRIEGRRVEVRQLEGVEALGDDEVLFIGNEYNERLTEVVAAVGERSVLIVTDAPDGLDRGGMVNFQLVEERVRFEISLARAEESGLMLSSRLLSAALRVETSSSCGFDYWQHVLEPVLARLRERGAQAA